MMQTLKRVLKSRAVLLLQDVVTDLNDVVGSNPHNVGVKGSMVDRTHRDPIRDDWFASFRILLDVCRIEKLGVAQMTKSAL